MPVLETIAAVAEKSATVAAEKIKTISETGVKEIAKHQIENIKSAGDAVLTKLEDIKNLTPEQLREKMEETLKHENTGDVCNVNEVREEREGLSDQQKVDIKERTGWFDEIVNAIGSLEEYDIYKNANLVQDEIGGKKCLIRNDIE